MLLKIILAGLLPCAVGFLIIRFVSRRNRLGLGCDVSLSYGIGMGILAQVMLWLGMMRFECDFLLLTTVLTGIAVLLWVMIARDSNRRFFVRADVSEQNRSQWPLRVCFYFLLALIGVNLCFVLIKLFVVPIFGWDSLATIIFKAKVLFYERSLGFLDRLPHKTYPLQIPFAVSWFSIVGNEWNGQIFPPIVYSGYLFSLIFGAYFLLQRLNVPKVWALTYGLLLLSSNLLLNHTTLFTIFLYFFF